MTPDEAFAAMTGLDPVKGIFFLASGKTAITRAYEGDGMIFRSAEGKPPGAMIVAIDVSDPNRSPLLVGGILVVDASAAFEGLGNGLFKLPAKALFAAEAVMYEAVACACGAWPARYGEGGARKCGGCFDAKKAADQTKSEAQGGAPGQGVLGV